MKQLFDVNVTAEVQYRVTDVLANTPEEAEQIAEDMISELSECDIVNTEITSLQAFPSETEETD